MNVVIGVISGIALVGIFVIGYKMSMIKSSLEDIEEKLDELLKKK